MRKLLASRCLLAISLCFCGTTGAAEPPVDFSGEILPLLSDRCAVCHGPDEHSRQADLRLDVEDAVGAETQNGGLEKVIDPGNPDNSELLRRMLSDDESEQMPPPDSNLSLSPAEIELFRRWIDQGAKWERHWSFRNFDPSPSPPKTVSATTIDAFIDAKLQEQGITPSPQADRRSLIRRLTLDLTGLPATPEQIAAFVEDSAPDAYEKLVDRLLATPAFGEQMAVSWLDAARYADTYGYQSDVYSEVWPWRDWVVRAFQQNMPYDQFLTDQLAGDLLPSPTIDSQLATTFNRLHRQTNEGGSVEEEFRAEYIADRVNTLGTAVLGLTLECARCHDHKYDPISQRDYYQFAAFFTNIDESGLYSHFTSHTPTPALDLPTVDQQRRLSEAEAELASLEQEIKNQSSPSQPDETSMTLGQLAHYRFGEVGDSISFANSVENGPEAKPVGQPSSVEGKMGGGLQMDGENGFTTTVGGDWDWYQPFTIASWIKPAQLHQRAVIWHRSKAWTDAASCGYELLLEDGRPSAALIHFWPGDAVRVVAKEALRVNDWSHVTVTSDGSGRAAGLKIYVDGVEAETDVVRDKLRRTIRGGGAKTFDVGHRFRDRGFNNGVIDELRIFDRDLPATVVPKLVEPNVQLTATISHEEKNDLDARQQQSLFEARKKVATLRDRIPNIMTMREEPGLHEARMLLRGAYDQPGEMVDALVPNWLGSTDNPTVQSRLDLARWLTRSEPGQRHPLVARVAVNRFWQKFFDRGLVSTPEDFGLQGQSPSHPMLLDYMAQSFVEQGWDVKQLVREIVTSDAYRRSGVGNLSDDPENRWFSRGPSSRLSIETIRDAALASANLISTNLGGPPVKPYQPEGLWKEKSGSAYNRDTGFGSHRRSLYTIWKRTSPPPSMTIFDAPGREVCVAGRTTTQTPLQALVLLNDEQFVEAARGIAFRVITESDAAVTERIDHLFEILLARPALPEERDVLSKLFQSQDKAMRQSPEAIEQFLAIGDFRHETAATTAGKTIDPAELATWTIIAQTIMNLDEWVAP